MLSTFSCLALSYPVSLVVSDFAAASFLLIGHVSKDNYLKDKAQGVKHEGIRCKFKHNIREVTKY